MQNINIQNSSQTVGIRPGVQETDTSVSGRFQGRKTGNKDSVSANSANAQNARKMTVSDSSGIDMIRQKSAKIAPSTSIISENTTRNNHVTKSVPDSYSSNEPESGKNQAPSCGLRPVQFDSSLIKQSQISTLPQVINKDQKKDKRPDCVAMQDSSLEPITIDCNNPAILRGWYREINEIDSCPIRKHIPQCLQLYLFSSIQNLNSMQPTFFKPELMMYGEEFEYETNIKITSDHPDSFSQIQEFLKEWERKLTAILNALNITDFKINNQYVNEEGLQNIIIDNPRYEYDEKYLEALEIQIGEWHCKVFEDGGGDDYSMLEINTS